MSRKLFSTILFTCFFVNACASPAPAPTLTPVPPTQTPTATATATLTPKPTVTVPPTPALPSAIVANVETALPGYTLQGDKLTDPEGRVVPEIKVIPHKFGVDGANGFLYERTYKFNGKPFTAYMQKADVVVMENGGLDMPAARYEDGTIKPEYYVHTDYASQKQIVTDIKMISLQEAIRMQVDSARVIRKRGEETSNVRCAPAKILNINNDVITFRGLAIPVNHKLPKDGFAIGSSVTNGINLTDVEDNDPFHIKVSPYCWASIEDRTATIFGYIDENGVTVNYIIDSGELNVPRSDIDPLNIHAFGVFVSEPDDY